MLEFYDIWFRYSENYILKGVEGKVEDGKAIAILGPTGSGKSTLLYILCGLLKPERGKVLLDGKPPRKKDVGLLFQNPDDQLFNATVFDEVAFALRSLGLSEGEVRERVIEVAEEVGIEDLLNRSPFKLSVGQKKAVALASILVYQPKLLMLDEPSANLDRVRYEVLVKLVSKLLESGKIVVITTHDIDVALELAHEICELVEGKLTCLSKRAYLEERLNESPVPLKLSLRTLMKINGLKAIFE